MLSQGAKELRYDDLVIGEELGSFEYVLTRKMLDDFRESVEDPDAPVPNPGRETRRHRPEHGL